MFNGRKLCIATMHQKEKVIAPLLENFLGVKCILPANLNTDFFGTFSGEIEREDNALTTARKKCLVAMELMQCDLAVASEGSFGMHPLIHFIPANDELLYFIDAKNNIEITARFLTSNTNFNGSEINSLNELIEFAKMVQFPSHALIIKNEKDKFIEVVKGINQIDQLEFHYNYFMYKYGKLYVETDMRAMHNPTRMNAIEDATKRLIENIKSCCPKCKTPGFTISKVNEGLPCETCAYPTQSILNHIYECKICAYSKIENYPDGKQFENPMYCQHCNP